VTALLTTLPGSVPLAMLALCLLAVVATGSRLSGSDR
jgi:hypothetical protein